MRRQAAGAFIVVLLCAAPAFAQRAYVEGGVALDARRFSGGPDDRVFDANVSSALIGAGGFLTSLISAGVELDFGRESEAEQSSTVAIAGRPETVTTIYTSRRRTVSALIGIHSPAQHALRVGAYAGLAFTSFDQRIATNAPPIVLSSPPPPTEFTHLAATPIVGVDVAIRISQQFALVGVVRGQSLDFGGDLSGFSVRPGVAARIVF